MQKVKKSISSFAGVIVVVFLLTVTAVVFFISISRSANTAIEYSDNSETESPSEDPDSAEPEPDPVSELPEFKDYQTLVDSWANSVRGKTSVIIYDLDNEQFAGTHNGDTVFNSESLYKLFVVYEGYLRRENGTLNGEKKLTGSYTWNECLDLAIRESNSTCGEAIRSNFGASTMNSIVSEWGINNTNIAGLTTTASDMVTLLRLIYAHENLSEETWSTIKDSMLNQPPSAGLCDGPCNWRRGLPSGFSSEVNVYNKVGWRYDPSSKSWASYHDTAIIEFPDLERHYIMAVLTSGVNYQQISDFGKQFEAAVKQK